jgi:hypothetical protein
MENKMVTKKTWADFRNTGLVLFINNILHVFGWAIVFEIDDDSGSVVDCYPARVKFRGFDEKSSGESFEKIATFLKENADQLHKETFES